MDWSLPESKEEVGSNRKEVGVGTKGQQRDPCGEGAVLYFPVSMSICWL